MRGKVIGCPGGTRFGQGNWGERVDMAEVVLAPPDRSLSMATYRRIDRLKLSFFSPQSEQSLDDRKNCPTLPIGS